MVRERKATEFMAIDEMLTGKWMRFSMNDKKRMAFKDAHFTHIDVIIKDWERRGLIAGYAPILTEKGLAYFNALRILYEGDEETVLKAVEEGKG